MRKPMFKTEEELEKAFQHAKHQLHLEGMDLTEEDERNIKAVLSGKMSRHELIKKILKGE
jgi:hypothetical protein